MRFDLAVIIVCCLLVLPPLAGAQATPPAQDEGPAFDCAKARRPVEHWVCADPALAQADRQLSAAYHALSQRRDEDRGLRREQRRWLRKRNACTDAACVAAAYAARHAVLQQALAQVPDLGPFPWPEPPAGSTLRIESIDDTRALGIRIPAAAERRTLQWEFYPDPTDRPHRFAEGPFAEVLCRPPDAREGYAARFSFHRRKAGLAIAPIRRGTRAGYGLLRMTLGTDLPLHEDIRCTFVFRSWLLDKPSVLYLVPVAGHAGGAPSKR